MKHDAALNDAAACEQEALAPLSDPQRRLWYMAQLDPGNVFYNVTIACRLDGPHDVPALAATLEELVARHEILRTVYPVIDGEPFQCVRPAGSFALRRADEEAGDGDRGAAIARFAEAIAQRRIDLEAGPVFEAHLLTLAPDCRVLVLLTHHIAIDQHSINVLLAELEAGYEARTAGEPLPFTPVPSYREYAAWHGERIAARDAELRAFWGDRIAAAPVPLPLPPSPGGEGRGALGAECSFSIGAADTERLRTFCRETRSTPFMALLSAFSALLHRYTGRTDFFVGTTTAFRGSSRFNGSLGCFINTLAIPVSVAPDDRPADLVTRTRARVVDAFGRYELSYERLVRMCRELHPDAAADFVNVYFQFQPPRLASGAQQQRRRFVPNINVHNGRAKFPLMLNASDRGATIDCTFEYEADRFPAAVIAALREDFVATLRETTAGGTQPVAALPVRLDASGWTAASGQAPADASRDNAADPDDAAMSPTEARLASIWQDLLGARPESSATSFVELGGHSLLAAQLAWRIRRDLGVNVRLAKLQQAGTLAAMARLIDTPETGDRPAVAQPASVLVRVGEMDCQLELGTWSLARIEELVAPRPGEAMDARMARIAWAFGGSPFQFESRRPLAAPGRLPVRLGAFDCFTFVLTVLALATAASAEGFVRRLAELRYRDPLALDSHPETGNIFDFAEEALVVNGIGRGLLRDVTAEVAGAAGCREVSAVLHPVRRQATVDRDELWATPKLGPRPIALRLIEKADFGCLEEPSRLRPGDVLLMSRGAATGGIVDHLGFVAVENGRTHLLQCTRHFALHPTAQPPGAAAYTGIFYDGERRREQIGVGIAGSYAGDEHAIKVNDVSMFGYRVGDKRPLRDYLDGAFSRVAVLRPQPPASPR
jgi:acyl carrier protein